MATPAEWEAAKKMAQAGEDADVIASSIGVSAALVKRRLKDDLKPRQAQDNAVTVSPHEAGVVIAGEMMDLAVRLSRFSSSLMDIAEGQLAKINRDAPGDTAEEMTMANTFMVMAANAAKLPMDVAKVMSKGLPNKGQGQGNNDKGRYDFGG